MPYPNAVATAAVVIGLFGPLLLALGLVPRLGIRRIGRENIAEGDVYITNNPWEGTGHRPRVKVQRKPRPGPELRQGQPGKRHTRIGMTT